jgi:hypothetical protein
VAAGRDSGQRARRQRARCQRGNPFTPGGRAWSPDALALAVYALIAAAAVDGGSAWFVGVAAAAGVGLAAGLIATAVGWARPRWPRWWRRPRSR